MHIDLQGGAGQIARDCQSAYRVTLLAPLDDMWAAFADMAAPFAIVVDGQNAGFCTVDGERALHRFFLHPEFEDRADVIFAELVERLDITSALPATVDSGFLSLSLDAGHNTAPVALMYQHVLPAEGEALTDLTVAVAEEHGPAVEFAQAAIGAPESFLGPYLGERIECGELRLYRSEDGSAIVATGELRLDRHHAGFAHLGMIVGSEHRNGGIGSRLMHALVAECRGRDLAPLCSTEPSNAPARRAIHRAGFRARHRVLRVALEAPV